MRQLRIALTLHYNLFQFNSAHYSLSCPLFSMAVSLILTHVFHGNAKPINETLRLQRSSMLLHESQAAKKRVNNVCLLCSIFFSFYLSSALLSAPLAQHIAHWHLIILGAYMRLRATMSIHLDIFSVIGLDTIGVFSFSQSMRLENASQSWAGSGRSFADTPKLEG